MSGNLTVVVAGASTLARALHTSGRFARVVPAPSTSALRDLLQPGKLTPGVADKIFVFDTDVVVDTPQTVEFLVQRLTSMGARVAVVSNSMAGRQLVGACPGAGLVQGTLTVNSVLGAFAGLPGVGILAPVGDADNIVVYPEEAAAAAQPAPAIASPFAAPVTPPASPFASQAPAAPAAPAQPVSPFGQPSTTQAPPAPQFTTPPPAQAPAQPVSPFAVPATPQFAAPSAQASPFPAPTPQDSAQPPSPFQPRAEQPAPTPALQRRRPLVTPGAEQPAAPAFAANPFTSSLAPAAPPAATGYDHPTQTGGVRLAPRPGARPAGPTSRRGFAITITAPKGGTGKSSLSLNLAAYHGLRLRGTGKNVCLIDANLQQADAGKYLNAFTPNLEDLLKDQAAIHPDRINNYLLHKPKMGLSVLLGPTTPEAANPSIIRPEVFTQILAVLREKYDYIFIDTPVAEFWHNLFREFALPQADFIAMAATPSVPTLLNVDFFLRQITAPMSGKGLGIDPDKIGFILNRAEADVGCSEDEVRNNLGAWRFLGAIPETKEWRRANNDGELIALKNFHELNVAFSDVLFAITGEDVYRQTQAAPPAKRGGLAARFFNSRKNA